MRVRFMHLAAALLLALAVPAQGVIETYEFSDEDLRARYHRLAFELRCPKCQNQNIADSNAPIAQDLRAQLVEQLESGASNDQIVAFMVDRYGEFVLYRPRFSPATAVLWLAPVLLLLAGVVIVYLNVRRGSVVPSALTPSERARLDALGVDGRSQQDVAAASGEPVGEPRT
jgi:cytochrome c-type biogenesis protein CcmH